MARPVKYLSTQTQRVYSNPALSPETAGVLAKTQNPTGYTAPVSAPILKPGAVPSIFNPNPNNGMAAQQIAPADQSQWGQVYTDYLNSPVKVDNTVGAIEVNSGGTTENTDTTAKAGTTAKGTAAPANTGRERKVVDIAKSYIGVNKYVYGSWDCSAFTQAVAKKSGVNIGRDTASQMNYFKSKRSTVSYKDARPGDIMYFRSGASPSGRHTGIYIGHGKMIDNSGSGRPIAVRNVGSRTILLIGRLPIK